MYVGSARSDPFARIDAFISPSETVDELQSYFSGKTASLDGSKNLWLVTRIVGRDEDNEESWPVDRQKFARDVAWACQRVSQILCRQRGKASCSSFFCWLNAIKWEVSSYSGLCISFPLSLSSFLIFSYFWSLHLAAAQAQDVERPPSTFFPSLSIAGACNSSLDATAASVTFLISLREPLFSIPCDSNPLLLAGQVLYTSVRTLLLHLGMPPYSPLAIRLTL